MALSNWDTLAFDHEGKPSSGVLEGLEGGAVRIYKNWVYINHPKMWCKEGKYVKDTIAEIQAGDLHIAGFDVKAIRHDAQRSIFVLAECHRYTKTDHEAHWMAGIGCSGYSNRDHDICQAAGINPADWDCITVGTLYQGKGQFFTITCIKGDEYKEVKIPYDEALDFQWVGVTTETLTAFFDWLKGLVKNATMKGYPNKEWVEACITNGGMRFNQGDAFFAKAGVIDEGIDTKIGEAEPPVISKMLGKD